VAPRQALASVGKYRQTGRVVRLRKPAAQAFKGLQKAAKAAGHDLIPVSGHRTLEYQKNLFERAKAKHGSVESAVRWVAPPGYSEHHTGYALDLGDGARAATDVDPSFENVPLFAWLSGNARTFGFEISFPPNNPQGVNYEPWHWRYVGDATARALFHSTGTIK